MEWIHCAVSIVLMESITIALVALKYDELVIFRHFLESHERWLVQVIERGWFVYLTKDPWPFLDRCLHLYVQHCLSFVGIEKLSLNVLRRSESLYICQVEMHYYRRLYHINKLLLKD